jgi:hypothetical protein
MGFGRRRCTLNHGEANCQSQQVGDRRGEDSESRSPERGRMRETSDIRVVTARFFQWKRHGSGIVAV